MTETAAPLSGILADLQRLAPVEYAAYQEAAAGVVHATAWARRVSEDPDNPPPAIIAERMKRDVKNARELEAAAIARLCDAVEERGGEPFE